MPVAISNSAGLPSQFHLSSATQTLATLLVRACLLEFRRRDEGISWPRQSFSFHDLNLLFENFIESALKDHGLEDLCRLRS
jgi:hypothetical protein